ncbi:MAG TPA: hypothetical protein VK046_06490 [Actinomycetaceae bacterium]|nr:hypothetical protein [Actinomycetaceae bacterium]
MISDQTPDQIDGTETVGRDELDERPGRHSIPADQTRPAVASVGEYHAGMPEAAEHREGDLTPDAIAARKVATHRPPLPGSPVRARGVEWIRPTDLLARQTATLAGRGIDFQADLSRRTRESAVAVARAAGDRARRLPPVSAFGRGRAPRPVSRSAVGMS